MLHSHPILMVVERVRIQVGPVIDPAHPDAHKGQYISAGYTGHGMPRAFSWCVISIFAAMAVAYFDMQRRGRRADDSGRHPGQGVGGPGVASAAPPHAKPAQRVKVETELEYIAIEVVASLCVLAR